jgi:hypothetical protein
MLGSNLNSIEVLHVHNEFKTNSDCFNTKFLLKDCFQISYIGLAPCLTTSLLWLFYDLTFKSLIALSMKKFLGQSQMPIRGRP